MSDIDKARENRIKGMQEHADRMEEQAKKERAKAEERSGPDREVEKELQTVRPGSDAPSRAGITSSGTGADSERG
jgi:hypothetical protein